MQVHTQTSSIAELPVAGQQLAIDPIQDLVRDAPGLHLVPCNSPEQELQPVIPSAEFSDTFAFQNTSPVPSIHAEIYQITPPTSTSTSRWYCKESSCTASFTRSASLIRHTKAVHGSKLFVCLVCGKRFGRLDTQIRHTKNVHRSHYTRVIIFLLTFVA